VSPVGQPIIFCVEKPVFFHAVGLKQTNFKAITQVSIQFLCVESFAVVVDLIHVSGLSTKKSQEADDLQKVASPASFRASLPQPRPRHHNSAGDKEPFHASLRLTWQNESPLKKIH